MQVSVQGAERRATARRSVFLSAIAGSALATLGACASDPVMQPAGVTGTPTQSGAAAGTLSTAAGAYASGAAGAAKAGAAGTQVVSGGTTAIVTGGTTAITTAGSPATVGAAGGAPVQSTAGASAAGSGGAATVAGAPATGAAGASAAGAAAPSGAATFTAVLAILADSKNSCGTCHKMATIGGGLVFDPADKQGTYTALVGVMSKGASGSQCSGKTYVVAGQPDASLLYDKVANEKPSCGVRMPASGTVLTAAEISTIQAWIAAGAKND